MRPPNKRSHKVLVTIPVARLRLGMFIASIEGSWWEHSFWRSSFLLRRTSDRDKILASGIATVVIDESRGLSLSADDAPAVPPVGTAVAAPEAVSPKRERRPSRPARRRDDPVVQAAETVAKSKVAVTRMFEEARMGHAIEPKQIAPLVEEIAGSVSRDPSAIIRVCRLKNKSEYTYLHSVAVCALMINLGRHLRFGDQQLRDLGMAGLLHDIGKMAIPDTILDKPSRLSDREFRLIQSHPAAGAKLLSRSDDVSPVALDVCLHHHERFDGTGYPFGYAADELSVAARMGAVCDVYDAVTSNRCYKPSWSPTDALSRMVGWEGHFDPDIFQAFVRSIGIFPIGTLVRLGGTRLGLVYAGNDDEPTLPFVRAFYDVAAGRFTPLSDIRTVSQPAAEQITGVESGEHWFRGGWRDVMAHVMRGVVPPDTMNCMADFAQGLV